MRVLHYDNWGYFEPITSGADVIASNQLGYFAAMDRVMESLRIAP
jgi:hypothetical protein